MGLFEVTQEIVGQEKEIMDEIIKLLIEIRKKLRDEKNYKLSDYIRDKLGELGVKLEDTKEGATWKFEKN